MRTFHYLQPGAMTAWPPAIELKGLSKSTIYAGMYMFGDTCRDENAARECAMESMAPQLITAKMYDRAIEELEKVVSRKPENASVEAVSLQDCSP